MASASSMPKAANDENDAPSDNIAKNKDSTDGTIGSNNNHNLKSEPKRKIKNSTAPPRRSNRISDRGNDQHFEDDFLGLNIHIPRRISVGNSVSPNQILAIFVGIMVAMLYLAAKMGSIIHIPSHDENGSETYRYKRTSIANRSKQRQEMIQRSLIDPLIKMILGKDPMAFDRKAAGDEDESCSLYLGASSIPESGWGWFAGKPYASGEEIRREHGHFRLIPPLAVSGASETPTTKGTGISIGTDLSQLLLKPHSVLSNVKWDHSSSPPPRDLPREGEELTVSVLVATRDIGEGEEFFLSWEDHPFGPPVVEDSSFQSGTGPFEYVFANSLPSLEHFERADEHIREARIHYFGAINYTKLEEIKHEEIEAESKRKEPPTKPGSNARWNRRRKPDRRQKPSDSQQQLYKPESAKDIDSGLRLWKRALERYDPLVAKLLPTEVRTLATYHRKAAGDESLFSSSSLLGSLQNQTVKSLAKNSRCVSSLEWQLVSPSLPPKSIGEAESEDGPNGKDEASITTTTTCQRQGSCESRPSYHQVVTRDRGFSKGETIGVVPLLVLQQSHTRENNGACLPLPSSSSSSTSSSPPLTVCPLGGIHEHTHDLGLANAEYRWSNSAMEKLPSDVRSLVTRSSSSSSLSPLSSEQEEERKEILFKNYPLSMSWDIVALRDLQQNETVVLHQPDNAMPFVTSGVESESKTEKKTD